MRIFAAKSAGMADGGTGKRVEAHTPHVSRNTFSSAVLVNEDSANITSKHSKGADSNGPEFAAVDRFRCCRL